MVKLLLKFWSVVLDLLVGWVCHYLSNWQQLLRFWVIVYLIALLGALFWYCGCLHSTVVSWFGWLLWLHECVIECPIGGHLLSLWGWASVVILCAIWEALLLCWGRFLYHMRPLTTFLGNFCIYLSIRKLLWHFHSLLRLVASTWHAWDILSIDFIPSVFGAFVALLGCIVFAFD